MRDTEHPDLIGQQPELGAPIRPTAPAPQAREVKPGIWRRPDGGLETRLPLPTVRSCGSCAHGALLMSDHPCCVCDRSSYSRWERRA